MAELDDLREGLRQHEINVKIDKSGNDMIGPDYGIGIREVILSTQYTKKKVLSLYNSLPSGLTTMVDLTRWALSWKSRADNVNLIHEPQSENHLNHAKGLLHLSLLLMHSGWKVHLIESTDVHDTRILTDVDLMVSKNNILVAIDYTNSWHLNHNNSEFLDLHGEDVVSFCEDVPGNDFLRSKLKKLKTLVPMADDHCVMKIMDMEWSYLSIIIEDGHESERSSHVDKAERYVNLCMDLKVGDVKELLQLSVERATKMPIDENQIRLLDELDGLYDLRECAKSLETNDVGSLDYLDKLNREVLSTNQRHDYSLDEYDRFKKGTVKPSFYTPLIRRSYDKHEPDKLKHCKTMINNLLKASKTLPIMTLAASLCVDDKPHPTQEEVYRWRMKVVDPRWGSFTLTRKSSKADINQHHMYTLVVNDTYENTNEFFMGSESKKSGRMIKQYYGEIRTKSNVMNNPEEYLDIAANSFYSSGEESHYTKIVKNLVNDSMHEGEVSNLMRGIATTTLEFLDGSLSSYFECHQKVCLSLLHMEKVSDMYYPSKYVPKSRSAHKTDIYISNVSGREATVISTASYNHSKTNNCSLVIEGDLHSIDHNGVLVARHFSTSTRWFDMSRSNLDWGTKMFSTIMSYMTLVCDTHLSAKSPEYDTILYKDCLYGAFLIALNDTKFCQYINKTNVMFKNSVGLANGTCDLYEKAEWYEPKKFLCRLYCIRLIKMTTCLQLLKANKDLATALSDVDTTYLGERKHGGKKKIWRVSFPAASRHYNTVLSQYNFANVSYGFSKTRHNLTLLQSQVLNKQIKSRKSYVEYRKDPRPTDMENLPEPAVNNIMSIFRENLFMDSMGGQHKPCHLTVMLGAMASLVDVHNEWINESKVLRDIVDSEYLQADVFHNIKIHDALNNKASVVDYGCGGVVPPRLRSKVIKVPKDPRKPKGEKVEKVVTSLDNQSDKAYSTLFMSISDYMKSKKPTAYTDIQKELSDLEYQKPKLSNDDLKRVLKSHNVLWPLVIHLISNHASMVARMIHKDDQKPREIAIMNIALRLVALFIETMARAVQRIEHDAGDYTNIIECADKDDRVVQTYNEHKSLWMTECSVMFDNEDKSGWGPHQDPIVHFICLRFRCTSTLQSQFLKMLVKSFMSKIFKVPDDLYLKMKNSDPSKYENPTNEVTRAYKHLSKDIPNVYNHDRAFLYADEGMFQGTLSVSSSCGASDCARLSNLMNAVALEEYDFRSISHVTSDDSTRFMSYVCAPDERTDILKKSLSIHTIVSNNYSYKRNVSDSVQTPFVAELNSIDHTSDGRIEPSIKSRIAFMNYYYEPDMYLSANNIINLTAEYVRKESSIMGSYWVMLLLSFNHLNHFGLYGHYMDIGHKIFEKPLELGGLPTIDPIMTVASSSMSNMVKNYGNEFHTCYAVMNDIYKNPEKLTTDLTDKEMAEYRIRSEIPRFTRSNITNICVRDKKSKRLIRELVMSLPDIEFMTLRYPGPSPLKALTSSFAREDNYYQESSSSVRYKNGNTPFEAKIFYVKTDLYLGLPDKERVSRKEILEYSKNLTIKDDCIHYKKYATNLRSEKSDITEFSKEIHDSYMNNIQSMSIEKIVMQPKSSTKIRIADHRTTHDDFVRSVEAFERDHMPIVFGGKSDIHPIIFAEALESYKSKAQKVMSRVQKVFVSVDQTQEGKAVEQLLIATEFIEGSKIVLKKPHYSHRTDRRSRTLESTAEWLRAEKKIVNGPITLEDAISGHTISGVIDVSILSTFHKDKSNSIEVDPIVLKASCELLWNASMCNQLNVGEDNVKFTTSRPLFPHRSTIYRYAGIDVRQMPLVTKDLYTKSEVISYTGKVYDHYVTYWKGEETPLRDTEKDRYHYYDMTGRERFEVELGEIHGIMCYKVGDHILLILDQYKNSLDAIPSIISQNDNNLVTLDLVEQEMMVDEEYRGILQDINMYYTNIDIADTEELMERRIDDIGNPPVYLGPDDTSNGDFSLDDYDSVDNIIMTLNANLTSRASSVTVEEVVYESETDSSEDTRDGAGSGESISSYEETTMASTMDNPLFPSSEIVNMIKDESIMILVGRQLKVAKRELKKKKIESKNYLFAIKLFPDMPTDLKNSFHHDSNAVLNMFESVKEYYNDGPRYYFFKAYVLNALRQWVGSDYMSKARDLVNVRKESKTIGYDSDSSGDGSYADGDWYLMSK